MCNSCFNLMRDEYLCLGDKDSRILMEFDRMICDYIECYNAQYFSIPALIRGDVLKKCGYFKSSPQQLTVAAVADSNKLKEILKMQSLTSETAKITDFYFTPAACLHFYPMLANKKIDESKCITTKARVYRYENGKHDGIQHFWDFTVREVVFVGSESYVRESLDDLERFIYEYAQKISTKVKMEQAFDHFYDDGNAKAMQKFQINNKVKRELLVTVKDREMALASFNFHGTHFSKNFNFDQNDTIVSGCVGFGLERWLQFFNDTQEVK